MGIDLQTKSPVARPPVQPVTLILEQSYVEDNHVRSGEAPAPESGDYRIPGFVPARLTGRGQSAPPGTRVSILSLAPGSVTIWIDGGGVQCIAEVIGPMAELLSSACRAGQAGFVGTITEIGCGADGSEIQVRVDGI